MVDIEARLSIEVEDVRRAAAALRKLAERSGAQISSEDVSSEEGTSRAEITLRVPAEAARDVLTNIEALGVARSRHVNAKDIGKEFYDATIRLQNLEAVRKRYEEILAQAATIEEILRIEDELSRVRREIEQLKGVIRWMGDRAARATVYVSLFTEGTAPAPILKPQAKLYPGLRGSYLHDFRGERGNQGYLGAGLVIGAVPTIAFELQAFRAIGSDDGGVDGLFASIGSRFYSEFLGDGNRHYLNPYLGVRGGYARLLGQDEILLGGQLGLELLKREWYVLDVELRSYVLFGSEAAGGHLGMEPTLGASVAF